MAVPLLSGTGLILLCSCTAKKPARKKPTFVIKDVRLFLNTVTRGLSMMKSAGVQANCKRQETEDSILLTITIPK